MSLTQLRPALAAGAVMLLVAALAPPPAAAQAQAPATMSKAQPQGMAVFDIPAQDLAAALSEFARQSGQELLYAPEAAVGKTGGAVQGEMRRIDAMTKLLEGTGLEFLVTPAGGMMIGDPDAVSAYRTKLESSATEAAAGSSIAEAPPPSDDMAAIAPDDAAVETSVTTGTAHGGIEEIIVTAQKKAERIQDIPIAISAFSMEDLKAQKIEGGFDLLKAIPNVTFSKSNFTGYNFSIRGVGTKAISATTDPGVEVAFNSTGLIQNRLFEQEYFDVERVEVLRGPQGTLYGRNATAGVINVISAKPKFNVFEGEFKVETGNYDSRRLVGMANLPIVDDMLAVRLAGSMTKRDGYDYNSITENNINGRDLWSGRVTIGFKPVDSVRIDAIWEHFDENDDRSRTGKQLCHRDDGPTMIGSTPVITDPSRASSVLRPALFSQGCKPGSLYDADAFGTPNGLALPFVFGPLALGGDCGFGCSSSYQIGVDANGRPQSFLQLKDPYGGLMQSRDLRTVASILDPSYRAKADLYELNADFDVTDTLTLSSQTAYDDDSVYSFQDYNRFNTFPIFTDTSQLNDAFGGPSKWADLAPGGVFCDPQIGCSDRLAGFDISSSDSTQFSQELRLQSHFDGPVNFSVGGNYTKFKTQVDYYVMYNAITALSLTMPFYQPTNGMIDISTCPYDGYSFLIAPRLAPSPIPSDDPRSACPYIDPNPVEHINGDGHNYFRSSNPYELSSSAAFGEVYWNITEALKMTAGLRWTDDRKTFTPVPSQVLLAPGFLPGGTVSRGYPADPAIRQEWREWTGRFGLDWKPKLAFTDETLLYAFYSRGYKGGGANPPSPGFATHDQMLSYAQSQGISPVLIESYDNAGFFPSLQLNAVEYNSTFDPEFVNSFEIGAKNTLFHGGMTLNATAFFYDYKNYQVSQIRDRTAVNENFDAKTWGFELETMIFPTENLQFIANFGYLGTRIGDGQTSIDIMNRTQGNPDYVIMKPWLQLPSNCVVPASVAESWLQSGSGIQGYYMPCGLGGPLSGTQPVDPATGMPYDVNNYPEINGGAGIKADLGGKELPNAPHFTANIGMQYGHDILGGAWRATFRTDGYWQGDSFARVYNDRPYDRLRSWYNVNVAFKLASDRLGFEAEFYIKNLLDKSPITDAFLNSDDTGLTTNVFVLDPRIVGLSLTKHF